MEITNSNYIIKEIKKHIETKDETFSHLAVKIGYSTSTVKGYYVNFMPVRIEGAVSTIVPMYGRSYVLTSGVTRRSKKRIKEAIEVYNEQLERFKDLIKILYKVDVSTDELRIEV